MDIKYRLYPHPVLWDKSDDYKNSYFNCDISVSREFKKFILNVKFEVGNTQLKKLIEEEKAEYIIHIESPATSYRIIKTTKDDSMKVILEDEHLLGKVSLCPFIVAKQALVYYSNDDLNDAYKGITFNLQKGTVLAIANQYNFKVDKEKEDLSQLPSIFTIYKKETTEETETEIELYANKIRIGLNICDYENYNIAVQRTPDIINSFIILPVLTYAFEQIKTNYDDFKEYRWFRAVEKIFKKYSMTFDEDLLNTKSSFELAQKIMNCPISKSLKQIVEIDNDIEEE